jgi:2-polyprenyl-3-methyl-5-hydroxy-6-metoxy-1,4-benzoquinol methylase
LQIDGTYELVAYRACDAPPPAGYLMSDDCCYWKDVSDSPRSSRAMRAVKRHLQSIRTIENVGFDEFLEREVSNRRVLDIGVADHNVADGEPNQLRHAFIAERAKYVLGVDIERDQINTLKELGYNVVAVDATSTCDLGEVFDLVFCGDVIEHIDKPVDLLGFASRHLAPNGSILVTTPNPLAFYFFWKNLRQGPLIPNLDHVSWITPTLALELARRSGLSLAEYILFNPPREGLRGVIKNAIPIESRYAKYTYRMTKIGQ